MARNYWDDVSPAIWPYLVLLTALAEERLSIGEFEVLYLSLYTSDDMERSAQLSTILGQLFDAVERLVVDPALRSGSEDWSPAQVREVAERTMTALRIAQL